MKKETNRLYKVAKYLLPVAVFVTVLFLQPELAHASNRPSTDEAWNAFMSEYRIVLASISGIGALTSILTFIFHFIKLGSVGSNPIERQKVLNNMLISGITTALLGGISVILAIFYHVVFSV